MGNSERDLKNNYPEAEFSEGLSIRGHQVIDSEVIIADWAKRSIC